MTINLEKRKEIDFALIKDAAEKQPRTFTELLRLTNLPRKTLSLRLKELCMKGVLFKNSGFYALNGNHYRENGTKPLMKGLQRTIHNKKIRTCLMLIAFLISFSASGYVLASFMIFREAPKETFQEPPVMGNFTMALDVNNVEDLYGWQVVITFNPNELKVLDVMPGGFLGAMPASNAILNETNFSKGLFCNASDIKEGMLLLGGSLVGQVPGKDGSGRLAIIVFGYFTQEYQKPRIAIEDGGFKTWLISSELSTLPIENSTTLTLSLLSS
jgi:hypothetical protein